jgi:hydrophobic/amphiphilic exporter-1 (mainly G- bacteria), HAE1 family
MKIIDISVRNGTAVVVGMILVVLFGLAALTRIPIQLNPTTDRPVITIYTEYPGAAAMEVESELTLRQEQRLATVQNLRKIRSESEEGRSRIELEFDWGIDKDVALIDINTKLASVRSLPEEAQKPTIYASNSDEYESVIRITIQSDLPVNQVREILEETIGPRLERVEGVATVRWWGGARREIQVLIDLAALDSRNVTIGEVQSALRRENQNRRGGDIEGGNSRMLVRTVGQYTSLDEVRRTVVKNGPDGVIRVEDLAEVVDGYEKPDSVGGTMGKPSVSVSIAKMTGANTILVTRRISQEVERINRENEKNGLNLWINYDASEYIWAAIFRVLRNLMFGAAFATVVLYLFLRSLVSTFCIAITIPLCLIGTFVLLAAFGRSVNVISLAGLAFAAGMVVDNAVVVMENIFRHRKEHRASSRESARRATHEVWAPILASSLTTLIVFLPVLFIREQAGQLFQDIAYSISFSVILSMIASITVIPMLASRLMGIRGGDGAHEVDSGKLDDPASNGAMLGGFARMVQSFFFGVVSAGLVSKPKRALIFAVVFGGFLLSLTLVPPAEYLPQSENANVRGQITNPTGMSLEGAQRQTKKIEDFIMSEVDHLFRMFCYTRRSGSFFGVTLEPEFATAENADKVIADLEAYGRKVLPSDFRFNVSRESDFGWRSEGKRIELDVTGPDMNLLQRMSLDLEDELRRMPEVKEVHNSFALANPELHVLPDRERLADLGMTSQDVANAVETVLEGTRASYYRDGGKEYELIVKAREGQVLHTDALRSILIATPNGGTIRLNEIARIEKRMGPEEINHIDKERALSLRIDIQERVALQTFIQKVRSEILAPFRAGITDRYGVASTAYRAEMSGTADDLERTMRALSGSFLFALLISYLLMAALFQSFGYPLIILFSVPLALTGGILGIWVTGAEFNVITMLGFVLLSGIVVNNAILLVDFSLRCVREGMELHLAAREAVRVRMRPIFMTSMTTAIGMLPLALGSGVGMELYSGLGVAVVGGMALSTLFTLILIPLLFATALEFRGWLSGVVSRFLRGAPSAANLTPVRVDKAGR